MMTRKKSTWCARIVVGAVLLLATIHGLSDQADAWPPYLSSWESTYPESTLPQRMNKQFGDACYVCHNPEDLGVTGTAYREDLRDLLLDGYTILEALDIAHDMDSTGDGYTNGESILLPRHDDPDHIGYHPGLDGCYGTDPAGPNPAQPYTGVPETPGLEVTPGDLTCDGSVGVSDLLMLLDAWGPCPAENYDPCIADLNDSGDVGVGDLLILLDNWG